MTGVQSLLVFATAVVFSLAFTPLILRLAAAYGIYDMPDAAIPDDDTARRRVHRMPTPRLGGLAIFAAFILSVSIWLPMSHMWAIVVPSLLLFVIGLVDDFSPLKPVIKLIGQVLGAVAVVYFADLAMRDFVVSSTLIVAVPPAIGFSLSVLLIVGCVNSINMIDGLDGLAGGVVLIAIALLSYLHFLTTASLFVPMAFGLPIIGALLGFLRYNTHPAVIFMGDSGSHWLGYVVGTLLLVVLSRWVPPGLPFQLDETFLPQGSRVLAISPLLCLAVPVFDSLAVTLRRALSGKNPMKADNTHFHHGLLRLGFSHGQAVAIIYFFALAIGICGILPVAFPTRGFDWAPYFAVVCLAILLPVVMYLDEAVVQRLHAKGGAIFRDLAKVGVTHGLIMRFWETANRYTIYGILMVTPLFAGVPPRGIGYAACFGLILLVLSFALGNKRQDFLTAMILSVTATILLVANNMNHIWVELQGVRYSFQYLYNIAFIWLLVSTCMLMLFSFKRRYLVVTPTDFLMVAMPLLLLLVPDPYRSTYRLDIIALRSWILFISLRFMIRRNQRIFQRLQFVIIVALGWVALTSILGLRIVY